MFTVFQNCGCGDGTTTAKRADCICTKTYYNDCDEGPDPCGDSMTVDLETDGYIKKDACSGSVTYEITHYDDVFSNVTISSAGVVSFDINANADETHEIFYKMRCPDDETSVNGRLVICVKNLCKQNDCTDNETCNECTGVCEPLQADLETQ